MKAKLLLSVLSVAIVSGCNNDKSNNNEPALQINDHISIYSGPKSNFDKAYMLANAFSSNDYLSILVMGVDPEKKFDYVSGNGVEVKVIPSINTDFSKLSEIIINNANSDKKIKLYLSSMDVERNKTLSDDAFSLVDEIYVVLEGTASFDSHGPLLDSAVNFYKKAKSHGVNSVKYVVWDSINKEALVKETNIGSLSNDGIEFHYVSFNEMKERIDTLNNDGGLISAAIYAGSINKSVVGNQIFKTSKNYDPVKDTVVLFGSYTKNEPDVSYVNQVEILKN